MFTCDRASVMPFLCLRSSLYRGRFFWIVAVFLILGGVIGPKQASAELKLLFSGSLESNLFVGLKPETTPSILPGSTTSSNLGRYFDYRNANSLFLNLSAKVSKNLSGVARVQFRNINFSRATVSNDLQDYGQVLPLSVRLYEMYIDFLELAEWFDLRVGQQRIAWGKALAFNPTDNLNPFNLENPLDFQERLPTPAIKASFYMGEHVTLTLVAQPYYVPAVLPISLFRDVATIDFDFNSLVPKGFKLEKVNSSEKVQQVDFNIENMQAAGKLSFVFDKVSFALSYFWGRLYVPIPSSSNLTATKLGKTDPVTGDINVTTDVDVQLVFPRVHVIGFDFSTSLGPVGVWAEVGLFLPHQSFALEITQSIAPNLVANDPEQSKRLNPLSKEPFCPAPKAGEKKACPDSFPSTPYPKVTVGLEYTFPGGFYFNLQYLFGFFNEQALDKLHHFAFLVIRQPFWRDRLMLQITLGGEMDATPTSGDKGDGSSVGLAFLVNAELQFRPFDSGLITLGGVVGRGNKGTTLALFQDLDQVFLRFRLSF